MIYYNHYTSDNIRPYKKEKIGQIFPPDKKIYNISNDFFTVLHIFA